MSNDVAIYYTCDVCGKLSGKQSKEGHPEGWALAEVKFYYIPRHRVLHKFDVCEECVLPDLEPFVKSEQKGVFKNYFKRIFARSSEGY